MQMFEYLTQAPATGWVQVRPSSAVSAPTLRPKDPRKTDWDKAISKLYMMMSLEDDWDGLGAEAPSVEIVASAIELAEELRSVDDFPPPTRVAATPSGTVGFEWQEPSVYTEAEITAPNRSEWMQIREGMRTAHWVHSKKPFVDPPTNSPAYWVNSGGRR